MLPAATTVAGPPNRVATARRYLMCAPQHFTLAQPINPWMRTGARIDVARANRQWTRLVETYRGLGHQVELLEPAPGLPDMVFAANGGIVIADRAFLANFAYPHRRAEADHHRAAFARLGLDVAATSAHLNEGEGDVLKAGEYLLAGYGFRSERAAHDELRDFFRVPVVSLALVDPRFYHLDVALAVLADDLIAYYPAAFSAGSVAVLEQLFPDAIVVDATAAERFALNAVSDGRNVVLDAQAVGFAEQLRGAGFDPVPVEMSELRKSGGSVKCCTLELFR